jgi:hypothetical protein
MCEFQSFFHDTEANFLDTHLLNSRNEMEIVILLFDRMIINMTNTIFRHYSIVPFL